MHPTNVSPVGALGHAPALVVANQEHRILFATANARRWLREFFRAQSSLDVLPGRVCRWLEGGAAPAPEGIRARRAGSHLLVRQYAPQPDECVALSLQLVSGQTQQRPRGTLSRRQEDVLRWVASGKSNKAIGLILKISPKTVGKHVENVFRKLGVTSRVAAANAYAGYSGERD
jgi:DNA-binding CsgD family transcriptional regulator